MLEPGDPVGTHSKVKIEAKEDILYLQQHLREFSQSVFESNRSKLIETLKKDVPDLEPNTEERFLNLVQEHLDKWMTKSFEVAGSNVEINGLTFEQMMKNEENYEPVYEHLSTEVRRSQEELNTLMEAVARKRQLGPSQIRMLSQDIISHQNKAALGYLPISEQPVSKQEETTANDSNYLDELLDPYAIQAIKNYKAALEKAKLQLPS